MKPDANNSGALIADDTLSADQAYRHITQGGVILWQGDFHNGKQLLQALARRIDRPKGPKAARPEHTSEPQTQEQRRAAFNRHRQRQAQRAALLNRLLVELTPSGQVPLRRAPDTSEAIAAAMPAHDALHKLTEPNSDRKTLPLRAVLGMLGAWEWQRKGVSIKGLTEPIHVRWGVFSPLRGEYLDLLWQAPVPKNARTACDIGTGSGILAIILAHRGLQHIVASDINPQALLCAQENIRLHGCAAQVELTQDNLFPAGRFDLIVCNPPWLPVRPTSSVEQALYDPDHSMLQGVLQGAIAHMNPEGQLWLIMSDLAEHLGLRTPAYLEDLIHKHGLQVVGRHATQPAHAKAQASNDPLHFARKAETTTLWRLKAAAHPQSDTLN